MAVKRGHLLELMRRQMLHSDGDAQRQAREALMLIACLLLEVAEEQVESDSGRLQVLQELGMGFLMESLTEIERSPNK